MASDAPPRAWRIHESSTGAVAVTEAEGRYYLVVEPHAGTRWEAEVTAAVLAAAAREVERGNPEVTALRARISELEEEIEFARSMLAVAAEHGLLDKLG